MRSARLVLPALFLAAGVLAGCRTSDRELVSDSLASHHYEAGKCARACCLPGTGVYDDAKKTVVPCSAKPDAPANCPAWKADLNRSLDELEASQDALEFGKLPKVARDRLKATKAQGEKEGKTP